MKRFVIVTAALGLIAVGAIGQPTGDGPAPKPVSPDDREGRIWKAFHSRSTAQADIWFTKGEYPKAIRILEYQHEISPENYEFANNLVWMYGNIGDKPKALETAVRFRLDNPKDPDASFPEAEIYFNARLYAKVVPILEQSMRVGTPHPNSYRMLAHSWARLGLPAQSVRVWDEYLKLRPDDEAAQRNRKQQFSLIKN